MMLAGDVKGVVILGARQHLCWLLETDPDMGEFTVAINVHQVECSEVDWVKRQIHNINYHPRKCCDNQHTGAKQSFQPF